MDFGKQTTKAIDTLLKKANRTFQETAIESFGYAVAHTPITSGDAISDWKFGMVGAEVGILVGILNTSENATTDWSMANGARIGKQFESAVAPMIHDTSIMESMYIENNTDYILLLENGGYSGHTYYEELPPYYVNRPVPFYLTTNGVSHKLRKFGAPRGMVKTAVKHGGGVYKYQAGIYNK